MRPTLKGITIITFANLVLTLLIWLPHLLSLPNFWGLNFLEGFNTIYRNYDGLEYVMIAKSWYDPQILAILPQALPVEYFPAHFPGYSLFILFFSPLLGFLKSMLFVSTLFTTLSAVVFYALLKDFRLTEKPLLLSLIFLILPARWLVVHTVGSSEPTFIFFVLLTIYSLMKFESTKKIFTLLLSALFASLALFTRPPGTLLFLAIGIFVLYSILLNIRSGNFLYAFKKFLNYAVFLLGGLTLLGIFIFFHFKMGNFWAYFNSGDNIHLFFPPLSVFNQTQVWVGDIWLEDIFYILTLTSLSTLLLFKKKLFPIAFFVMTYLIASIFVAHRDLSRYLLPTAPFVLIAFEKILTSKEFRLILPLILIAAYLYAQNFILGNTAPYPNPMLFN